MILQNLKIMLTLKVQQKEAFVKNIFQVAGFHIFYFSKCCLQSVANLNFKVSLITLIDNCRYVGSNLVKI